MDRMGRTDLADQLFGNRLDIADQEIVVDLLEPRHWRHQGFLQKAERRSQMISMPLKTAVKRMPIVTMPGARNCT